MKSKLVQKIMCFVLTSVLLIADAEIKVYAADIPNKANSVATEEIESSIEFSEETEERETEEPADSEDVTEETEERETGAPAENTDVSEETDIEETVSSTEILDETDSVIFYSELPEVDMTLNEGNVLIGLEGTYYTETAETILNRINEIRLEACREGVRNPVNGAPLTEADYVPLKWSSDLEAIARLRAAEAAMIWGHTRPNGYSCFSVRTLNGIQAEAECLASTVGDSATIGWDHFGLMAGIESWYSEKKYFVEGGDGQTGHYEELINPYNRYVGIGAFGKDTEGQLKPCTVAGEFSSAVTLDSTKNIASGRTMQYMEIPATAVLKLMLNESAPDKVEIGSSFQLSISGTVKPRNSSEHTGPIKAGAIWESSDENVLAVDENGIMTALKEGSADISITVGKVTSKHTVHVYGKGKSAYQLKRPLKTTYLVGESIDLKGAQIVNISTGKAVSLTPDMVSGYDAGRIGVKTLYVAVDGYALSFDILVVAIPVLTANGGQTLSQITLPQNDYGVWQWDDPAQEMDEAGRHRYKISFTPNNLEVFQKLGGLDAEVDVYQNIEKGNAVRVSLYKNSFTYNGTDQRPKAEITFNDEVLKEGVDYSLSYVNNRNVGTADLIITGEGYYLGTVTTKFMIEAAKLEIIAKDKHILCNDPIPQSYDYEVKGLAAGESLLMEPVLTCDIESTEVSGMYYIIPDNAAADSNYDKDILYRKGRLTVSEEEVSYVVSFNSLLHGKAPADYVGVKAGDTIQPPEELAEEGFVFAGWYKDVLCTTAWDFDTDTVQSDLTLYARWLTAAAEDGNGLKLCVQDIPDLIYTGNAQKPAVAVYDSDGTTLLKLGKDYTVKYVRNIDAVAVGEDGKPAVAGGTAKVMNPGKASETITDVIGQFSRECPYVVITGKGNYTETIYRNFLILPAQIVAAEEDSVDDTPLAAGFTLKYTDQFEAKANKTAKIVSSFKYKKALKEEKDYVLSVQDENGAEIALTQGKLPLNTGVYTMTVNGKGNYTGVVRRKLYVAENQKLMKNASVIYTKTVKAENADALSRGIEQKEVKVKIKGQEISADNYTIDYAGTNHAVGTATMILTGKNGYVGTKNVTFKITGAAFSAATVEVKTYDVDHPDEQDWKASMPYTGRAVTQNKVTLTTKVTQNNQTAQKLTYGEHYTITYKNNVKKGTATMIFTAKPESGYSGSFKKTFKITPQDLSADMFRKVLTDGTTEQKQLNVLSVDENKKNVTVKWDEDAVHAKNGASLSFILCNPECMVLKQGTDYTVSYKDHKSATKESGSSAVSAGSKQPIMTVKGKGNYGGTLTVQFQIIPASIAFDSLMVSAAQVQKKNDMKLKDFKLKIMDGKAVLKEGIDYRIDDAGCTPEMIKAYADSLGTAGTAPEPKLVLTGIGNYGAKTAEGDKKEISLADYIYVTKLTSKNLKVEVTGSRTYTGQNVEPAVKVSYYKDNNAAKQDGIGVELTNETDYKVTYGNRNIPAGKKKGSITITGAGIYGGSVTVKFDIEKKRIY